MKKTLILLATAAMAFVACNKEVAEPIAEESLPDGYTITAVSPEAETKALVDGLQVKWTSGDQISLFQTTGSPELFTLVGDGPVTTGTFKSSAASVSPNGLAAFPGVGASNSGAQISIVVPAEFPYGTSPIPMIGMASSATTFGFSVCSGAVLISFTGVPEEASKFILTSDKNVCGTLDIPNIGDHTNATFNEEGAGKTFTVTGVTPGNIELTIPLIAGTHSLGIKLVASDGTTEIAGSVKSIDNLSIEAGKISKMQAIDLSGGPTWPQIYKISKLWIWGGTGPQYNCTKLYEMLYDEQFKKYERFDNTDNRGVRALCDNYLVFNEDGSFQNWAGEDGRNWWFIYTNTNGSLSDLTSFYDLLPRSEATYSLSGESLTFTMPGGTKVVTAKVLAPGTYDMPNTSPVKQLTVSNMTLQLTISGGTDYWDGAASDLDVFAKHPRAMFLELEEMPAGFEIPESSKTIDKDFAYVPPFTLADLPGTWNVYGGNSQPYGIWVLGGSGSDPALVSPLAKTWLWNDTISNESDNSLTITPTGGDATTISGTCKWEAGTDGAFWDYVYKSTGEDLSRFYDVIPKGNSAISMDVANWVVSFENGNTAKILKPGTHKFTQFYGTPTLTVPTGCFALQFHLMDQIAATSQHYNDIDRFVNAPLEYIIIFEKP